MFIIGSQKVPKLLPKIGKSSPCSHSLSQSLNLTVMKLQLMTFEMLEYYRYNGSKARPSDGKFYASANI
jgi:hypothetical protein